jgi:hypothetical protein
MCVLSHLSYDENVTPNTLVAAWGHWAEEMLIFVLTQVIFGSSVAPDEIGVL